MSIKMKVVTMQFTNKQNKQASPPENMTKECKIKETANKWLQIMKQESIYRIQNAREFICEQNIQFFIKFAEQFVKNLKQQKQQKKTKQTIENQKALRQSIEKISKKLSQSFHLINYLKQKIEKKQSQLTKKDQIIVNLKKECLQWKQKIRKELIVKQLSQTSRSLLNSLQLTSQSYSKPYEVPSNLQSQTQKKENFFYRTSSFELSQNKSSIILQDIGHKRNMGRSNQGSLQNNKAVLRLSKREYYKTFDKLKSQISNKENDALTNGLMVTQKQISPHKDRRVNKQN